MANTINYSCKTLETQTHRMEFPEVSGILGCTPSRQLPGQGCPQYPTPAHAAWCPGALSA